MNMKNRQKYNKITLILPKILNNNSIYILINQSVKNNSF